MISAFWQNKQTIESLLTALKEKIILSYFHVSCTAFMREQCYIFGLLSSDSHSLVKGEYVTFNPPSVIRTSIDVSLSDPMIPPDEVLAEQHIQLNKQMKQAIIDADWPMVRQLKQFILDIEEAMHNTK